jgi:hypothetical protein
MESEMQWYSVHFFSTSNVLQIYSSLKFDAAQHSSRYLHDLDSMMLWNVEKFQRFLCQDPLVILQFEQAVLTIAFVRVDDMLPVGG